jgi:hypothetical protein
MNISKMIMVLKAYERGENIEMRHHCDTTERWYPINGGWHFESRDYRIAPKKELSLVERIRNGLKAHCLLDMADVKAAADRIEELERYEAEPTLVEELRLCAKSGGVSEETLIKAADRIEELEKALEYDCSKELTTDELLAEIKRRVA